MAERFFGELGGPGAPAKAELPDGARVVFDSRDGFMVAVRGAGDNVRVFLKETAPEKSLLFTTVDDPGGNKLVIRRGRGAVVRISDDGSGEYFAVGEPKPQLFHLAES